MIGEQGPPVHAEPGGRNKIGQAAHEVGAIRVIPEDGAALDAALVGRRDLIVSDLAVTELASAIARRTREGDLSRRMRSDCTNGS